MSTPEERFQTQFDKAYTIRKCFPVDGDWFEVKVSHEHGRIRVFLQRIIMWALIDVPNSEETLQALTNEGFPTTLRIGDFDDFFYVKGADQSLTGQTWQALYDAITPSWVNVRELSKEQAKVFQK